MAEYVQLQLNKWWLWDIIIIELKWRISDVQRRKGNPSPHIDPAVCHNSQGHLLLKTDGIVRMSSFLESQILTCKFW